MRTPRVGVTTSADRYAHVGRLVADAGLHPIAMPCISISARDHEELAWVREQCSGADLLFITSSRTIDLLWPSGGIPPIPVVAVGRVTAELVKERGGRVAVIGASGAVSLAQDVSEDGVNGLVVFPRAADANPEASTVLRDSGATVLDPIVYETTAIAPSASEVDAVMFGSSMAVMGWLQVRSLDRLVVAALGETTAGYLTGEGYRPDVVPQQASYRHLAEELARFMKVRIGA